MKFVIIILCMVATIILEALGDEPFTFCKDTECKQCPVAVTSGGTGYPNCVIYNTADIFSNQDFPGAEGG